MTTQPSYMYAEYTSMYRVVCKKIQVGVVWAKIYSGQSEKMLDVIHQHLRIMPMVLHFIIEQFCVYTPTLCSTF